jgi:hypothetical protein
MNGTDRSRAGSVPDKSSSAKPSAGLGKLFGKKKDKKETEQVVLTSRHAGAVKNKLAHDPKVQKLRRDSAPAVQTVGSPGSQSSLHLSASEQEMRRPHSGSPALHAPKDKSDMPMLTRIVSGDEADELDEWEKMRDEWRHLKVSNLDHDIIEGVATDAAGPPQSPTDERREVDVPSPDPVEEAANRHSSTGGLSLKGPEYEPRPSRTHTPLGGRFKKDDKGAWKR